MTTIAISRVHFPVTTLGPGNRLGIWLQGCSIRCPGCISADTWSVPSRSSTILDLVEAVADQLGAADGITVSGGEPFDQPEGLEVMLKELRRHMRRDQEILVFSGHPLEMLLPLVERRQLPIDALISDPFLLSELQTRALRGSDNQRLTCFTPLGRERFMPFERDRDERDKALDLMMDDRGTAWFAGIPDRDLFAGLEEHVQRTGGGLLTSQDMSYKRVSEEV